METILEEAAKFSKGVGAIQGCIEGFRKRIPMSKTLAKDAEAFCDELERLLGTSPDEMLKEAGNLQERLQELETNNQKLEEKTEKLEGENEELQDQLENSPENMARFIRDNILDRESDATLRNKLERFTEAIIMDKTSLEDVVLKL